MVLIEPRDRFVFVPLLYELMSGELKGWEVAPDYASLLEGHGISHLQDRVSSIDLDSRSVTTASGQSLHYSQLVMATGAQPDDFGIPGVRENALQFHTLTDLQPLQEKLQQLRRRPRKTVRSSAVSGSCKRPTASALVHPPTDRRCSSTITGSTTTLPCLAMSLPRNQAFFSCALLQSDRWEPSSLV